MKIGIMSMQRVNNYGSFLQAYGLMHTLQLIIEDASVEFVDYEVGESLVQSEKKPERSASNFLKRAMQMLSPEYRKYRNQQLLMGKTFGEFCDAYQIKFLPQIGVTEKRNICPELDVLVIGSDEVFNCTQEGNLVGYSNQLFGKDHCAKRLISYAASFGSTTKNKLEKYNKSVEVGELLENFDAISVRDVNSLDLIEQLCGVTPNKHIDPVLLYNFPEVDSIRIDKQNYIVVYAYADRIKPDEAKAIREFAKKYNKKIITLGFWQPFTDEYVLATPLEVLAYIRNADYVVTDTFHGTVFSIKYQVPFATIIRESNKQKLGDLLATFDLEQRQVMELDKLEAVLKAPIEKEMMCKKIAEEQDNAKEYLLKEILIAEKNNS